MVEPGNVLALLGDKPEMVNFFSIIIRRAVGLTEDDLERSNAIVKSHFPEWTGKAKEFSDLPDMWHLLGIDVNALPNSAESRKNTEVAPGLVNSVGLAMMDITLWICADAGRKFAKQYFDGLTVNESLFKLLSVFINSMDARRKGGESTRILTPETEPIARECIAGEMVPGVSKTSACDRAAARLFRDYGIEISGKSLMPLAKAIAQENA